jgi:hypothetical protein
MRRSAELARLPLRCLNIASGDVSYSPSPGHRRESFSPGRRSPVVTAPVEMGATSMPMRPTAVPVGAAAPMPVRAAAVPTTAVIVAPVPPASVPPATIAAAIKSWRHDDPTVAIGHTGAVNVAMIIWPASARRERNHWISMIGRRRPHCLSRSDEQGRQDGHRGYGSNSHQFPPAEPSRDFKKRRLLGIVPVNGQVHEPGRTLQTSWFINRLPNERRQVCRSKRPRRGAVGSTT